MPRKTILSILHGLAVAWVVAGCNSPNGDGAQQAAEPPSDASDAGVGMHIEAARALAPTSLHRSNSSVFPETPGRTAAPLRSSRP